MGTFLCTLFFTLANSLKEGECEVCIATVNKFVDTLDETVKKDPKKIEEQFRKFCKGSKNKENRFVSITVNLFTYKILIMNDVSL